MVLLVSLFRLSVLGSSNIQAQSEKKTDNDGH